MIHAMKYEGYFALAGPLAELMISAWPRWQMAVDVVVPIALHADRQRERGYNQAELLGRRLAQAAGLEFDAQALSRTRKTRPQVGLGLHERRANVRDAFTAAPSRAEGRRVLLVDDVCTSGATLSEAAAVLLAAGAEAVSAYCLAAAVGSDQAP
jgi:ComF family protein